MVNHFRPLWGQPYALTTLLTGVLAALMAIIAVWKTPRSPVARWWAIMCGCVAGWAFINVLSLLSQSPADSIWYLRLADAVALFIPVTFLHFAMHFAGRVHPPILRLGYGITGFVALTVPTPWFISTGQWKFGMWFEKGGPAFVVFAALFVILPAYGVRLMLQTARTETGVRRAQLVCLALASGLGFLGGFMWFLPALGVDIPPIGGHWIAIYCVIAAYAILRYQFLDIRVVIRKSVVYSALVTIFTLAYFTVAFVGERYFQSAWGYQSLALSLVVFAGMALVFQPLKQWLQTRVDRWWLPEPQAMARRLELLEQEVREADKAKAVGRLAAGVAHEIKNPLAAIQTFLSYLPQKRADAAFMAQFQQVVGHEVDRLQQLAQGLVDFAKPHPPQRQPVDLKTLIEQVLALTRADLADKRIQVDTAYHHNGTSLLGDAPQLSQALLNLILNARDAMPQGGTLTVTTRSTGQGVELALADTGHGIAPQDLPRLFEPYFTRKPHGTGLGLSIVQRILQDHGGTIAVDSHLTRGTIFTIHLPASVAP